jgi:hypothetical protein
VPPTSYEALPPQAASPRVSSSAASGRKQDNFMYFSKK